MLLIVNKRCFSVVYKGKRLTYYELLEVPQNANKRRIKQQFSRLSKIYHPDVYRGTETDRYTHIIKAYSVLKDTDKRRQYDRNLGLSSNGSDAADAPKTPNSDRKAGQTDAEQPDPQSMWTDLNFGSTEKLDKERLEREINQLRTREIKTNFELINVREGYIERQMSAEEKLKLSFVDDFNRQKKLNDYTQTKLGYAQTVKETVEMMNDKTKPEIQMARTPIGRFWCRFKDHLINKPKTLIRATLLFTAFLYGLSWVLMKRQEAATKLETQMLKDEAKKHAYDTAQDIRDRFIYSPISIVEDRKF